MDFEPVIINHWLYAGLTILLAILSFLAMFVISRFDEPPAPRTSNKGIKERICWIPVVVLILGLFIYNEYYFVFSLSAVKTFPEKASGVKELLYEARHSRINPGKLRNLSPEFFRYALLSISQLKDSYADDAILQIRQNQEYKDFQDEQVSFKEFMFGLRFELRNFEMVGLDRGHNKSCRYDYIWGLEIGQIFSRLVLKLEPMFESHSFDGYKTYALGLKMEIPRAMNFESKKISMHISRIGFFFEFLNNHISVLENEGEDRDATRRLNDEHFYAVLIMAGGTGIGVVSSILIIYILVQLIRHREEDFLNSPLQPNMAQPEILNNLILMAQRISWLFAVSLFLIFIGLIISNKIHPTCQRAIYQNSDQMSSFDTKSTITADEFFRKCLQDSDGIFSIFRKELMVDYMQLINDLEEQIESDPLDTALYKEILFQQELNTELLRLFNDVLEQEECATGLPKEVLQKQKNLVKSIVEKTNKFISATEKLKSSKLQKLILVAFFNQIKLGISDAVNRVNWVIGSAGFNCRPIAKLRKKCWELNCMEYSYFDESLIHWLILSCLLIVVAFLIERINCLNFTLAEEWEVAFHNQPLYFGRHTYNPRYVTSERRTGRPEIKNNADVDCNKNVIETNTTDTDSKTTQSSQYTN